MEHLSTLITLVVLGLGAWNTYMHLSIKTVVLELQLNIRKDMNGRYQTLEAAKERDRVQDERLERVEDKVFK